MSAGYGFQSGLRRFSYLELDAAPTGPGIYAWYIDFPAGPADWEPRVVDGTDKSVASTGAALLDFAGYLRPRSIQLTGAADYGLDWTGVLDPEYLDETLRTALAGDESGLAGLAEVMHTPAERRALGEALRAAIPVFSSPIYIGVTQELNDRLSQHKRDYERAHAFLAAGPENREQLLASPKFGVRLAASAIPVDHLSAYTLEIGSGTALPPARRRAVAHLTERLLQRAFRPLYGRR